MGVVNYLESDSPFDYSIDYYGNHFKKREPEHKNGNSDNGRIPSRWGISQETPLNVGIPAFLRIPRGPDGEYSDDHREYTVTGPDRTFQTRLGSRRASSRSIVVTGRKWPGER